MTKCDYCNKKAKYDAKSLQGPWAYMCQEHYDFYGSKVSGLYTILKEKPEDDNNN